LPADPACAPATKKDTRLLMEHIGGFYDKDKRRIGKVEERLTGLETSMQEWKKEIIHEFVAVENIRHDLEGANKDRIENQEHRIHRLERQRGFAA
jgi:hypothetical protein